MKRIVVDAERCIECNLCQQVCSLKKSGVVHPASARVRVKGGAKRSLLICLQCGHRMCQDVCLPKAMSISPEGAVIIDTQKCDGCGKCLGACNNQAITVIENVVARVCDLCGGAPECAALCPTGAIRYMDLDRVREEKVFEAGRRLLEALEKR